MALKEAELNQAFLKTHAACVFQNQVRLENQTLLNQNTYISSFLTLANLYIVKAIANRREMN